MRIRYLKGTLIRGQTENKDKYLPFSRRGKGYAYDKRPIRARGAPQTSASGLGRARCWSTRDEMRCSGSVYSDCCGAPRTADSVLRGAATEHLSLAGMVSSRHGS
ncbi:unnamed protein product [Lota lota]